MFQRRAIEAARVYNFRMNLAVLSCGSIPESYYPITGGGYDVVFGRLFAHAPQFEVNLTTFEVVDGEYPDDPSDFDGFLVTGSSASVYDDTEWVKELARYFQTLYSAGSKLVGVCFGHQMMAHALGGKVVRSPKGWGIGVKSFEVYEQEAWLNPPLKQFEVLMSCQDQVVEMPPDGKLLAGSDFCNVGMFKVGENMLGIQGHPEFLPAFSEALMNARTDRIPADTIAAARKTLDRPRSTAELATWMLNFING